MTSKISLPDYPAEWPSRLTVKNDCQDFSGLYSNEARVLGYSGKRYLSWVFSVPPTDFFQQAKGSITSVRFQKSDQNKYRIRFYYSDKSEANNLSEIDTKGDYSYCDNGDLVIAYPPSVGTSHGAYGKWTEETRFSKTSDGSLVIKKSLTSLVALFYFIPTYTNQIVWELYKPY